MVYKSQLKQLKKGWNGMGWNGRKGWGKNCRERLGESRVQIKTDDLSKRYFTDVRGKSDSPCGQSSETADNITVDNV